jgi:hypothetical protein
MILATVSGSTLLRCLRDLRRSVAFAVAHLQ